jgi:hypothetical protein
MTDTGSTYHVMYRVLCKWDIMGLESIPRVTVVGTGAFAQGLCAQAVRSGATLSYSISMASRKIR